MKRTKKISLITYHRAYNYGSALQAYASVKFFSDYGFDTKIIDYIPSNFQEYGSIKKSILESTNQNQNYILKLIKAIIKTPSYKRQIKVFNPFISTELPLTKSYFSSEELKKDLPETDFFCTGSDQVWNNYYTKSFESAFFLDFVPKEYRCFSFAASFGKEKFSEIEKKELSEKLKKYDYITVRENAGLEVLKNMGFESSQLMLDPTLMICSDIWSKFAQEIETSEPYILVYQLHGDSQTFKIAEQFSRKNSIKLVRIVTMFHQMRPGCKNIIIPNIHKFVGLFKAAEYVFTDSFHGTVFSLIFKKKLAVTLPQNFSDRIITLLNSIDSKHFIVKDLVTWESDLNKNNYFKIEKKLMELRSDKTKVISEYLSTL